MSDPARAFEPGTVEVRITEVPITAGNPSGITVDRDPFQVSKGKDANSLQVEWICLSNGFSIEFKADSPFTQARFISPGPGSLLSGPVRDDVQPDSEKNYAYSVRIGDRVLDPGGVVNP